MEKILRTLDVEKNDIGDDELIDIIKIIQSRYPCNVDLATKLVEIYVASGESLIFPNKICIDVASTGGPSSLSTLLIPLFFSCVGLSVPKLGISGRPAGAIDSLAQIPNYSIQLNDCDIYRIIDQCNYAHFLANKNFTPLDARIIRIRKKHGAMDVPTLATASLLSKKISVGVSIAGLDIRVAPHGNMGATWSEANKNAAFFKKVADSLGIQAITILTDARFPFQPFIGRRESLIALMLLFEQKASKWLAFHYEQCRQMALICAPLNYKGRVSEITINHLKKAFIDNLQAQGANYNEFYNVANEAFLQHTIFILAEADGFISYNLEKMRNIITEKQTEQNNLSFTDPIGLHLLKNAGEWVRNGEPIVSVRCAENEKQIVERLKPILTIDPWHAQSYSLEEV